MREHAINSAYGALDYIAYPAGMLLLAPAILHALGMELFGIWALTNAVLMTGAILASGFTDANIRSVARARARRHLEELKTTVRSTLGIQLVLGVGMTGTLWLAAPAIAHLTVKGHEGLAADCLWSMRIAAGLILLRAVETVCVSTQRAFGRYGAAIGVSVTARIVSLLLAWIVPKFNPSVTAVLAATLAVNGIAIWIQMQQLKRILGLARLVPTFHLATIKALLGFGVFTWLQAASGLLVGQVDRLASGFALGASAVAVYTICVQLTQPIYGMAAAGLHFIFPLLASDSTCGSVPRLRRFIGVAFAANFTFVALTLVFLLFCGEFVLRHWVGLTMANAASGILPVAAWGSALSALSVTGSYSLLALDRPRAVAILHVAGGVAMAGALPLLVPPYGLAGVAYSRLLPGCAALIAYLPLLRYLTRQSIPANPVNQFPIVEEI